MFSRNNEYAKLNLSSPEFRSDPWTAFGRLCEQGPVLKVRVPLMGKMHAATSYEAVNEVLKDSERFVREPRNAGRTTYLRFQFLLPRAFHRLINNMLSKDGDDHRRLRSLVDRAFARHSIESLTPRMTEISAEHLQGVQQSATDGIADLIPTFARPLPLTVICELLGLPMEDRARFAKWFEPFSTLKSIFGIFKLGSGMRKMNRYLTEEFENVRNNPRPGLMTDLVQTELEGDRLNDEELLAMVFILLVAGHETTTHLISNTLFCLSTHPEMRERFATDQKFADRFIDEVQRYASPIQFAKPRFIANDTEFYGAQLEKGKLILPVICAANYDPARFEDPHRFNPEREQNFHMSFGSGPHTCLGMKLAKAETAIAIRMLHQRWPNWQTAFDPDHCDWSSRPGVRGFNSFRVRLQP